MLCQMPRAHDTKITSFSMLTLVTLTEVRLHSFVLEFVVMFYFLLPSFCSKLFWKKSLCKPFGELCCTSPREGSLKNELKFLCTAGCLFFLILIRF